MEMTNEDWINFGGMYDNMVGGRIIPNLTSMSTDDATYYGILISDPDDIIECNMNSIDQWFTSPLEAIKSSYSTVYIGINIDEIIDNLSVENIYNIHNISNELHINTNELISKFIKQGITLYEKERNCSCCKCK